MQTIKHFFCTFLFLSSITFSAQATLLVEWDLANVNNPDSSVPTVFLNAGLTAQNLSANGVTTLSSLYSGYKGAFTAHNWPDLSYDSSKYYSFSVSANSGTNIAIEKIDLSLLRGNNGGGIGVESWELYSSLDGFVTSNKLASYDISTSALNEQVPLTTTFDPALNLTSGNTLSFRLYGYYAEATSDDFSGIANMVNGDYSGDIISGTGTNLALYGNFLPEPSIFASIGILALMFIRRLA